MAVRFDDLDDLDSQPQAAPKAQQPSLVPCYACGGSGTKIIGYSNPRGVECFTCHGTGKTKAGAKQRHDAWKKGQETQRTNLEAKRRAFDTEFPDVVEWVLTEAMKGFEFAKSLQQSLLSYGSLTEGQIAAVRKCMQRSALRRQEWQASHSVDAGTGGQFVLTALNRAYADKDSKGRVPSMRTEAATFSLAKPTSKNPGCVYIKCEPDKTYLGKITAEGRFMPSRDCSDERQAAILEVLKDPLEAAVRYGRLTGQCSCCGRRLDNAESVRLGIGPICRVKMFG